MAVIDRDRWRELEPLLDQALDLSDEERIRFLDELRSNSPDLAAELTSLLSGEAVADQRGFLVEPLARERRDATLAGLELGAYTLERALGQGGMGSVWLAHRSDGRFEGNAAVKLLNLALVSPAGQERFRQEGSVLARLTHPGIARLLDAGVSPGGQPYLVLEYVDGKRIDVFADERGLSVEERVRLFLQVLSAVSHAHANLIVHRDLKPSNILVTADGTAKLLDFGLAKLLEQDQPGKMRATLTTYRWMTPEYAAPEQILGTPVTPRTDVYQLGAVLYTLLTDRTPFGRHAATLPKLQAAVLTEEHDPMGRAFRGDLDAVVSKALRKDPAVRYASAREFADDIRRYLVGHPVQARRQTLDYRARRFVVRNRVRIAAAAGTVLVLATSLTTAGIERARTRRTLAGMTSRGVVADSVTVIERELLAVSSAVDGLTDTANARRLLQRAPAQARALSGQPERRARLLEAAGRIQAKLGEYDSAFSLLQDALVIRRRLSEAGRAGDKNTTATAVPRADLTAAAATDPTRRKLLFVRPPGTVFMVDEDGTHEVRITDPTEIMTAPAWAPDGRVLLSRLSGVRGIYVANPDGTGLTRVTAPPPGWEDLMPVALGNQIVFGRTDSSHARDAMYRVNLDGTGLTLLARDAGGTPAPSPKGDFLVFGRGNDIYRLDLRRGVETRLTNSPTRYKGVGGVSPDGRKILFTRIDPGRLEQIFVMNVDGTNTIRVSRGDYYDFLPRWSPDGNRIAFTSSRDGTNGVYTMRADGSDVRDVSRTPLTLAMRPGVTVLHVNETLWAWMKY